MVNPKKNGGVPLFFAADTARPHLQVDAAAPRIVDFLGVNREIANYWGKRLLSAQK
jgi:hypothetical protein